MGWSAPEILGGGLTAGLDVVSWQPQRLDVFAPSSHGLFGSSSLLHWFFGDSGWAGPDHLGGSLADGSTVTAAAWAPGRLDVFGVGGDRTLQHWFYPGSGPIGWSGPEALGGSIDETCRIKAVSWGPNRLDVFAIGKEHGDLLHWWYPGAGSLGWGGPESLGGAGALLRDLDAVSWGPNRLDVFAAGHAGIVHWWWDGQGWGGPETFPMTPPPWHVQAAAWGPNRLDVLVTDGVENCSHLSYPGSGPNGWSGPETVGPYGASTIVSWRRGRIDSFTLGYMGRLFQLGYQEGSGWRQADLGWTFTSLPRAVAWAPDRIDIFGLGNGNSLQHVWFDPGQPDVAPPAAPQPSSTPSGGTPSSMPAPARDHMRFTFSVDPSAQTLFTVADDQVYVAVAPPGTPASSAPHYRLTHSLGNWWVDVPASAGPPGTWWFRCHVRGLFGDGSDTGDMWSPLSSAYWNTGSPAATFILSYSDATLWQWHVGVLGG